MRRPFTQVRRSLICLGVAAVVTGCALGERPSLADVPTVEGVMTGDELIDRVLQRLDQVDSAVFTAEYRAVVLFGKKTDTVRVAQESPGRRSVTVGDIRYLTAATGTQTCVLSTGVCEGGINAARISDTAFTPDMVFGDLAKRLRRDATAKIGESTEFVHTVGEVVATCVDIAVDGGIKEYCALENGVAAKYTGADVTLDLISYRPTADQSLFTTHR